MSNEFAKVFWRQLDARDISQSAAAGSIGVSRQYLGKVVNGHRFPSAGWLDIVATNLKLSDAERVALHRAAVRDAGYQLNLSKK